MAAVRRPSDDRPTTVLAILFSHHLGDVVNTFLSRYFSIFLFSFVLFPAVFVPFFPDFSLKIQISIGQGWGRPRNGGRPRRVGTAVGHGGAPALAN